MRVVAIFPCVFVAGCALVSGLDGLDVEDASTAVDAQPDVIHNDVITSDSQVITSDASDSSALDAGLPNNANLIRCASATCVIDAGQSCCGTPTTTDCHNSASICNDVSLACDDDTDCTGGAKCCYVANAQGGISSCMNVCSFAHLCIPGASIYCKCAPFDSGTPLSLGTCG